jgi:lipopolysaccharide transport system ATP-binding protein
MNIIECRNISKKFTRNAKKAVKWALTDLGREIMGRPRHRELRATEFWALKDVNFSLEQGEALGLLGVNGSGKTTLIKILSGLVKPDNGSVLVRGRVAPLIALGAGFSPNLSGKENIYLNMRILGLAEEQVEERLEEVIAFADIGDAIEAPVRSYSSGMEARLGFACAVFTDPEILLVDEILAVGDLAFRNKCFRKIASLREQGMSLIYVSHASASVTAVCDRALWLDKGVLKSSGPSRDVVAEYEDFLFTTKNSVEIGATSTHRATLDSPLSYRSIEFSPTGKPLESGASAEIVVNFSKHGSVTAEAIFEVKFLSVAQEMEKVTGLAHSFAAEEIAKLPDGNHSLRFRLNPLVLSPGRYQAKIIIRTDKLFVYDAVDGPYFEVQQGLGDRQYRCYQPSEVLSS